MNIQDIISILHVKANEMTFLNKTADNFIINFSKQNNQENISTVIIDAIEKVNKNHVYLRFNL
jgi:hypothetical protein